MVAVAEDALCHTPDRPSFIEGTINIVDRDGLRQWIGGQLVFFNKRDIYEESSGTTI